MIVDRGGGLVSRILGSTLVPNLVGLKSWKKTIRFFSFTLRPASAVGNVGAIIFGECFHNVNYLRNAPRKKGLKLGKNVESRSTTLAEKYWTNITRYPPIGLWVSTLLILVMVRFISVWQNCNTIHICLHQKNTSGKFPWKWSHFRVRIYIPLLWNKVFAFLKSSN